VYEPKQAMQTIQLAIKHATTGTPGPVAVVFGSRSLQGTVKTQRPPRVHATDRVLAPNVLRPAAADVARVAEMLLASSSPVILAGNGVHASRAWSELTALADLTPGPVAVVFGSRSLQGTVKTQRPPRVHATDRVLAPNVLRPAAADVARVAEMLLASSSPVILAGNGVHASRAWSELTALADL